MNFAHHPAPNPSDFIRAVAQVRRRGKYPKIRTRFPEPNGYLHSATPVVCLNFGIALEFGGVCNLRGRH